MRDSNTSETYGKHASQMGRKLEYLVVLCRNMKLEFIMERSES